MAIAFGYIHLLILLCDGMFINILCSEATPPPDSLVKTEHAKCLQSAEAFIWRLGMEAGRGNRMACPERRHGSQARTVIKVLHTAVFWCRSHLRGNTVIT